MATEFHNCPVTVSISPKLDYVVAGGDIITRVVALPSMGARLDLQELLLCWQKAAKSCCQSCRRTGRGLISGLPGAVKMPVLHPLLLPPASQMHGTQCMPPVGNERMWARRWCPAGTHMILSCLERSPDSSELYQVSTYLGDQLISSFVRPSYCLVLAVAGGAVLHCVQTGRVHGGQWCIRTVLCDGTLIAEHRASGAVDCCKMLTSNGNLLAVASTGDMLFVCSADGHLQAISLGRPALQPGQNMIIIQVSSCKGLAAVCIIGEQPEVVFVDLAQQRVMHRHDLPEAADSNRVELAQSSCSLALCHHHFGVEPVIKVLATTETGPAWLLSGAWRPAWDVLGRFLAVLTPAGMSVYSASGPQVLACLTGLISGNLHAHMYWLPDAGALMLVGRSRSEEYAFSRFLLKFW